MKKILLIVILLITILMANVQLSFCDGDNNTKYTVVQSTNHQESSLRLEVSQVLKITKLPSSSDFDFLLIEIHDEKATVVLEGQCNRYMSGNEITVCNLSDLSNGKYYVQVFNSDREYGTYRSYIHGRKLAIKVQDGIAKFVEPLVYHSNQKQYLTARTDKYALSHYQQHTTIFQSNSKALIDLATAITLGLNEDYEKAQAIHEWVCKNIYYDWDAYNGKTSNTDYSALGTLSSLKGVCAGYASLTVALLRAVKIPAKVVEGYALGVGTQGGWDVSNVSIKNSNHAWTEAYVDGRWIIIDTTWDSNNEYREGEFIQGSESNSYQYFDTNLEFFSLSHKTIRNEENIPNWWHEGSKTFYLDGKGNLTTGWKTINGNRYYFGKYGIMAKGVTLLINGKKYRFDSNGILKSR